MHLFMKLKAKLQKAKQKILPSDLSFFIAQIRSGQS